MENRPPRVSVVVPNYNHARYLPERLYSIFTQTFRDFELIYLDDASHDESGAVWARYENEPRVSHVVVNPENSGSPFAQWNRGVSLARGQYVWLAEADDVADARFLERLVAVLEANPKVGVAYCQSDLIDETGSVFGSAYDYNLNLGADAVRWRSDFVNLGKDEVACFLARQCTIPNASAAVFRKSVYEEANGADPALRLGGDHLLWTRMLLISDVAFVAEALNRFRRHGGTVRHGAYRDGTNILEGYQIARYIRDQVDVPAPVWEAACDDLMDRYLEMVLLGLGKEVIPTRRKAISELQRLVDSHPQRRFARRLIQRTLKKVGGLLHSRSQPGTTIPANGGAV